MKLKCPSCSKLLQIPDSAAGKVVKCPCGKQLRVPGAASGVAPSAARTNQPAARPMSRSPQSGSPSAPRPVPQPASTPPSGFGGLGIDDGLFDELTESDHAPVAVAPMPGTMPAPTRAPQNPYASPVSSGGKPEFQFTGRNASRKRRFANYILDNIFILILSFGVGIVLGIVMVASYGVNMTPDQAANMGLIANILGVALYPLYYVVMEGIFGVTIAKLITKTRVVSEDGSKPGFGKILGRTLARFIPFEQFSYLFGDTTTGWHDTLSGTRVIHSR